MNAKTFVALAAASVMAAAGSSAFAQDTAAPENAPAKEARKIEEVYVTATKRSKSVRDIPISIDAFSGDMLVERGATSLEEIVKYSSGVILTKGSTPDQGSVTIRGVSNSGGLFTRTVGRFYDNVSLINPSVAGVQPDIDPFDMAAVEILKGPQGTLFGGSALAGAIRYVPQTPDLESGFGGSVSLGYGTTEYSAGNNSAYTTMLNLPLSDNIALRYAGSLRRYAGYIDEINTGEDDVNDTEVEQQRLVARWQVNDALDLQLTHLQRRTQYEASAIANGDREDIRMERDNRRIPEFGNAEADISTLKLNWNPGGAFTISFDGALLEKTSHDQSDVSPYLGTEDSGVLSPSVRDTTVKQPSYELRLVSNELSEGWWVFRDWEYVAGFYYMESDQLQEGPLRFQLAATDTIPPELLSLITFDAIAAGTNTDLTAVATEKALFFDMTREFPWGIELNLGGRYFEQVTDGLISAFTLVENPAGDGLLVREQRESQLLQREVEESDFLPKVALTWHATEDIRVIASYAEGFRFGGVNPINDLTHNISGQPYFFDSDSLKNYELGVRSQFFDRALTVDLTAFQIPWDNMQVQTVWNGTFPAINNIGAAEVRGAELGFKTLLPWNFTLMINATYAVSKTEESFDSSEGFIEEGTILPLAPRWTGSTVLSWNNQWGDFALNGSLAASYQGDSKNNFGNTLPIDALTTYSASFGAIGLKWRYAPTVNISITNLTNERAMLAGVVSRDETANSDIYVPAQPRTISLSVGISF